MHLVQKKGFFKKEIALTYLYHVTKIYLFQENYLN